MHLLKYKNYVTTFNYFYNKQYQGRILKVMNISISLINDINSIKGPIVTLLLDFIRFARSVRKVIDTVELLFNP